MEKKKKITRSGPLEYLNIIYYRARGFYKFSINQINFKGDPYHLNFWRNLREGIWEPHTFRILDRFLKSDSVVCDFGSWIGPTVIYSARKCAKVFCFEPDYVAYHFLLWNLRLNQMANVVPFNIALASDGGIQKISSFGKKLGDTQSSLLGPSKGERVDVLCLNWNNWHSLVQPKRVDFIKMDIEGSEFTLLTSMKEYLAEERPTLYLSTHPHLLPEGERLAGMQQLRSILENLYQFCLTEQMAPVAMNVLEQPAALKKPHAFIFTNEVLA